MVEPRVTLLSDNEARVESMFCRWDNRDGVPTHRVTVAMRITWSSALMEFVSRDPDLRTEVEVRFVAEGSEKTRVDLEHRLLENYGEAAETMQSIFDSDGGWTGILARFAIYAAGAGLSQWPARPIS